MINRLAIIVPAYNEADNLTILMPQWIDFCKEHHSDLIIVNDGSRDGTRQVLDQFADVSCLKVVHHKVNRGYGGAIKSGIREAGTEYVVTIDADGQHQLPDVLNLFRFLKERDADMVIGSRKDSKVGSRYRSFGKWLIRKFTAIFLPLPIYDMNSGMKLYKTSLAKRYIEICPDSMSFSDIITLIFMSKGHLVLEQPITIKERMGGSSTINVNTAFETIWSILNITMLFKPIKIFLPLSLFFILAGVGWGLPIVISGRGISIGASLSILAGVIFLCFGLIAEQLALILKARL